MTAIENEQIKALDERVGEISEDIKEIKTALLGDAYNKNGVIARLEVIERGFEDLREDHNNLKASKDHFDYRKKWLWGAIFVIVTFAANLSNIIQLFKK